MRKRALTVTGFFIFNVLFFTLYLSCIHRNKTTSTAGPAPATVNPAFSRTVITIASPAR